MFIRNQKTNSHYDDLFEFIQKNKTLPAAIASLSMDLPEVSELLRAITESDFTSPVFQHDNVDLFLLYLIKEQKIRDDSELNFWSGMTVYLYILALRQYTDQLSVMPGDKKREAHIEMVSFAQNGELTDEALIYFKTLSMKLERWHIVLSIDAVKKFLLSLPTSEQYFIKMVDENGFSGLLSTIGLNIPFMQSPKRNKESQKEELIIPSFSMMNYFLQCVSPQPLRLQPAFGRIGLDTLGDLHKDGVHHVALSSLLVKSNLLQAHSETNAFAICMHDVLHAYMGSLLSISDRRFLFDAFIPHLKQWATIAVVEDQKFANYLNSFIEECNDLDLSPTFHYLEPEERLEKYIYKNYELAFGMDRYQYEEQFFFLQMTAVFQSDLKGEEKYGWLRLLMTHHALYHSKKMEKIAPLVGAMLFLASHEGRDLSALELAKEEEVFMAGKDGSLYYFNGDYMPFTELMTLEEALVKLQAANIPTYWVNDLLAKPAGAQESEATVVTSSLSLFATGTANQTMPENKAAGAQYSSTM